MILTGNPPIDILVKRNARARRLSLRVSRLDGRVSLSLPRHLPEREARQFVQEKESWIRDQLGRQPMQRSVAIGATLLFRGQEIPIEQGTGRGVKINETCRVGGNPDTAGPRIAAVLKQMARQQLSAASDDYAARLGVSFGRLTLRDTRSRWGSCSSNGGLMYSWRLIMAPPEVLAYVAAHEVAHLVEMNHSAAYWAVVERIYPAYQAPRRWLRENGAELHRYRFSD